TIHCDFCDGDGHGEEECWDKGDASVQAHKFREQRKARAKGKGKGKGKGKDWMTGMIHVVEDEPQPKPEPEAETGIVGTLVQEPPAEFNGWCRQRRSSSPWTF
ncbi:unnamed protein product, partial [Polarella glacialis]